MPVLTREIRTSGGRRVLLTLPEGAPRVLIFTHGDAREAEPQSQAAAQGAAVACVLDVDWNAELSPWPAPRAFARGEDFAGRGGEYLRELVEGILPEVEAALEAPAPVRAIAGYSLAGLFALYAAWNSAAFRRCASMSGSLWFDGFLEKLKSQPPAGELERCYFSLGAKESKTSNPRMGRVEVCTREAEALLRARGVSTQLVMHPGGHFQDVPQRVAQGLLALI